MNNTKTKPRHSIVRRDLKPPCTCRADIAAGSQKTGGKCPGCAWTMPRRRNHPIPGHLEGNHYAGWIAMELRRLAAAVTTDADARQLVLRHESMLIQFVDYVFKLGQRNSYDKLMLCDEGELEKLRAFHEDDPWERGLPGPVNGGY